MLALVIPCAVSAVDFLISCVINALERRELGLADSGGMLAVAYIKTVFNRWS